MMDLNDIAGSLKEFDAYDMTPVLIGEIAEIVGRRNVSMDLAARKETLQAKVHGGEATFSIEASLEVTDSKHSKEYDVVVEGRTKDRFCELTSIRKVA